MSFCRAFQSLPEKTLKKYFGQTGADSAYANVGLNIIPPLLQSQKLSEPARIKYVVQACDNSPDPEVRAWLATRNSSKPHWKQVLGLAKAPLGPHYRDCLFAAMSHIPGAPDPEVFSEKGTTSRVFSIQISINEMEREWSKKIGRGASFLQPSGSRSASIAFVLDYGYIHSEKQDFDVPSGPIIEVPWGFREKGFTADNSQVWTLALRQYSSLRIDEILEIQKPQSEALLAKFHHQIIQHSAHKVIFLCGTNVRRVLLLEANSSTIIRQIELCLGYYRFEAYVDLQPSHPILYIFAPELPWSSRSTNLELARRLDLITRFAVILTNTRLSRDISFESSSAVLRIIRQASEEKKSEDVTKLTFSNLDTGLKAWLYRKDFVNDEDIKMIEDSAGSLTRGLLMLLHVLPRKVHDDTRPARAGSQKTDANAILESNRARLRKLHQPFEEEKFQLVRDIYNRVHAEKERRVEVLLHNAQDPILNDITERQEMMADDLAVLSDLEIPSQSLDIDSITRPETSDDEIVESWLEAADQKPVEKSRGYEPVTETAQESKKKMPVYLREAAPAPLENVPIGNHLSPTRADAGLPSPWYPTVATAPEISSGSTPIRRYTSVATGVSRCSTRLASETKFRWYPGNIAQKEWDAEHKIKGYLVRSPDKAHRGGFVVTLCYMQIFLPPSILGFGEPYMTVHPEFSPDGQPHPRAWASSAPPDDPASRLAIRVKGKRENGEQFDEYVQHGTKAATHAANAFADRVLEGLDPDQFRHRPRRHVPAIRTNRRRQ